MDFSKLKMDELARWPDHCLQCPYLSCLDQTMLFCGYCIYSGHARICEPANKDIHHCSHWKDKVDVKQIDDDVFESLAAVGKREHERQKSEKKSAKANKSIAQQAFEYRQTKATTSKRDREQKMFEMYNNGAYDEEIANAMQCTRMNITRWRRKYGLPSHGKQAREASDKLREELYAKGLKDAEIAVKCGCTPKAIESWRRYRGLNANK